jgi:Endomembrane protein 70
MLIRLTQLSAGDCVAVELHQRAAVPAGHCCRPELGGASGQPLSSEAYPLADPSEAGDSCMAIPRHCGSGPCIECASASLAAAVDLLLVHRYSSVHRMFMSMARMTPARVSLLQWYLRPSVIALMGGLLPFGSIFIEVYYILTGTPCRQCSPHALPPACSAMKLL